MTKALTFAALCLIAVSGSALASPELAKQKNCLACHAVDKKLVGPSYKDVAAKYKGDKDAVAKLAKKIREGGVGVWGQVPMPANPAVNEQEALTLAKWVLSQYRRRYSRRKGRRGAPFLFAARARTPGQERARGAQKRSPLSPRHYPDQASNPAFRGRR